MIEVTVRGESVLPKVCAPGAHDECGDGMVWIEVEVLVLVFDRWMLVELGQREVSL